MSVRNKTIDFLRCVAILLVLIGHILLVKPFSNKNFLLEKINLYSKAGGIGVDLFFVISGFLISGLIFKEYNQYKEFQPLRFLIRRGFKIYPLYYIGILMGLFFYPLILKQSFTYEDLLSELFFLVNYVNSGNPPLGHLWSLAVEEHFYFFLSLFLFILIKLNKISFTIFLNTYLLFFIIGLFLRIFNFYEYQGSWWKVVPLSLNRFDSLFFGVLLAYIFYFKRGVIKFVAKNAVLFFIISICIILLDFSPLVSWNIKSTFLLGINPISFGLIMIILIENKKFDSSKLIKPLAFIGRYSYSIYIFHPFVIYTVKKKLSGAPLLYFAVSLSLSVIIGMSLSKLIEIPFLKIRDKLFPSRSNVLLQSAVAQIPTMEEQEMSNTCAQ